MQQAGKRRQIRRALVALAFGCTWCVAGQSARAQARLPERAPATIEIAEPSYKRETSRLRVPNVPLLTTGAVVFAGAYVPSVIGAAVSERPGDQKLYIPIAGPWLALVRGQRETAGYKAMMTADGIAQGIGGLAVLLSSMIPDRVTEKWYLIGAGPIRMTPTRLGRGYGVTARTSF
jgi:hypothetical protein